MIAAAIRPVAGSAIRAAATLSVAGILSLVSSGCREPMQSPTPASIIVQPGAATLNVGDTLTLVATVLDDRGTPIQGATVSWTSADSAVVHLDGRGLVYGLGVGTATLTAAAPPAHADVVVIVDAPNNGWQTFDAPCGLWSDGLTYCWPAVQFAMPLPSPEPVTPATAFKVVRAGLGHTCGLTAEGRAYCWGSNGFGQLGDGTTIDRTTPVEVAGGLAFDSIALGAIHTCALTRDGVAYCWGANKVGQLGVETVPGTCLGFPCSPTPVRTSGNRRYRAIAAGGHDRLGFGGLGRGLSCALDETGAAFCWGSNFYGAIGDGTRVDRFIPTAVSGVRTYAAIGAGAEHACALAAAGRLHCWGLSNDGQLGRALPDSAQYRCLAGHIIDHCISEPVEVESAEPFAAVAVGAYHTCALDLFGAAFCWGDNQYGQAGVGSVHRPMRVSGGWTYRRIMARATFTCGVTGSGTAHCWGNGFSSPQRVPDPLRD